jgi:hypothetical protein
MTKRISLNLDNVPESRRETVKSDVAEFLLNETLRDLSRGVSPLTGSPFKSLSKEYANAQKGGDTTPNLELEGDMLDDYDVRSTEGQSYVEIGFFKGSDQIPKADGHNNWSGRSELPQRRFIPKSDEQYRDGITNGINQIIRSAESDRANRRDEARDEINEAWQGTNITDLFGPEAIDVLIEAVLRGD